MSANLYYNKIDYAKRSDSEAIKLICAFSVEHRSLMFSRMLLCLASTVVENKKAREQ